MRKVQITIKMDLFGDQSWDGHHEKVGVYADANTPHEALSAALYELLGTLQEQGHKLPEFGCRHHKCDPAASGLTEEEKNAVREQRRAETEQKRRQFWETYDNTQKEADRVDLNGSIGGRIGPVPACQEGLPIPSGGPGPSSKRLRTAPGIPAKNQ